MKIEIGEDNGFLFGGVPSLVVVSVLFDDGRQVRFPYTAEKTIAGLYEDLSRFGPKDVSDVAAYAAALARIKPEPLPLTIQQAQESSIKSTEIEKGDIVECIHLENRDDHAGSKADQLLFVGSKYRVTKVQPGGYECLDDAAPLQFKLFLMKHEVKLFAKGKKPEKKVLFLEEAINCPKCTQIVYCGLHDGFYIGTCECGQDIKKSREEVKRGQASNPSTQAV